MSMKLRELIKTVRSCKTAQEEREVIAKECAEIRTSFKEGEKGNRARNIAKLLYIHMLGYPTHFGQMECLKLIASPKFHEKRVGYLGLTQLLDESTEILMLVTNSIKNDINNINQYVSGIALCALGNIGNQEMCLALSQEVQNQLSVENPMIRKKAALCAMRIAKKVDDIEDKFNSRVTALLEDKNHGVVVSACCLLIHLLETNPEEYVPQFSHCIPVLVKTLKLMLMSGYANASEYDFSGIVDPFLQVKILHLIRLFGSNSGSHGKAPAISKYLSNDELNDLLAQIATNTDGSKNSGNSVLYECVRTIMSIKNSENGLRVLGVNILGKFLLNKDNNIRYVALQMLQDVVKVDVKSVMRHKSTVIGCLNDSDVSIKKRALEVLHALVNAENVKSIISEMLSSLMAVGESAVPGYADRTFSNTTTSSNNVNDFKEDLASRICMCIDKWAPDKRWQIETSIKVLVVAGNYVSDEQVYGLCHAIAGCPELQGYAVFKLFFLLAESDISQLSDSLVLVAAWVIGEFGADHLFSRSSPIGVEHLLDLFEKVIESAVASICDQAVLAKQNGSNSKSGVCTGSCSPVTVCEYVVSALIKVVVKSGNGSVQKARVERILSRFTGSIFVDLQQRVCEFLLILSPTWEDATRAGLFEEMPHVENGTGSPIRAIGDVTVDIPDDAREIISNITKQHSQQDVRRKLINRTSDASKTTEQSAPVTTNGLLDLDDLLGGPPPATGPKPPAPTVTAPLDNDLLKDIFG